MLRAARVADAGRAARIRRRRWPAASSARTRGSARPSCCSSGSRCRGRSPGSRSSRQKELLGRYRMASRDRAAVRPRLAAGARRRALPGAGGAVIDPRRASPRCCATGACEVAPGAAGARRSTTLAEPLVRALHRAVLDGRLAAAPRVSPLAGGRLLPPRARAQLDGVRAARAGRGRGGRRVRADRRAGQHQRAGRRRSRAGRRAPPRARRPVQRGCAARRWCGTIWPTAALASRRAWRSTSTRRSSSRALFLDRPRSGGGVARARATPAGARGPAREGAGDPDRGRRDRSASARRGAHLDQLRRAAEHAERRGVHRPARGLGQGHDPLHVPSNRRGVEVIGRRADVPPTGEVVEARARARRAALRRRSRPTPARASSASSGSAPTPGSTAPPGPRCSTRRSAGTVHLALGRSYPETGGATPRRCTGT